jgi:hypothetical protein
MKWKDHLPIPIKVGCLVNEPRFISRKETPTEMLGFFISKKKMNSGIFG